MPRREGGGSRVGGQGRRMYSDSRVDYIGRCRKSGTSKKLRKRGGEKLSGTGWGGERQSFAQKEGSGSLNGLKNEKKE